MGRVLGPLLSLDASKSVGGALTYKSWRGINTVSVKSNPSNPRTEEQNEARSYFATGGKISKRTDTTGSIATQLRESAPAGQSYASYFTREVLGSGNVNIKDAITAYGANETEAGFFDTAAAAVGIEGVNTGLPGAVEISPGEVLWAAYAASFRLGHTEAPVSADSATATQVDDYAEALTGTAV